MIRILSVIVFILFSLATNGIAKEEPVVRIRANNPLILKLQIEVKCDWNGKNYKYHRFIVLQKKSLSTVEIPHDLNNCELWPKILW